MESERAFPPPGYPISLNTFYKSNPHTWKEPNNRSCELYEQRDLISKQLLMKRRFPRLDIGTRLNSVSPRQDSYNFMKLTEQSFLRSRSKSPQNKNIVFKPCNYQEAKMKIERKVSIFDGNPYNDQHDVSYQEYLQGVKKRINGKFKPGMKGKYLDNKMYLNGLNTFETFSRSSAYATKVSSVLKK